MNTLSNIENLVPCIQTQQQVYTLSAPNEGNENQVTFTQTGQVHPSLSSNKDVESIDKQSHCHFQHVPGVDSAYGHQPPIANQPSSDSKQLQQCNESMNFTVECTSELRYLISLDQLFVKPTVESLEVFTGFQTNNRYAIINNEGQNIFFAVEDSNDNFCSRSNCAILRRIDVKILDSKKNEVIHLRRHVSNVSGCFPCCLQKMEVFSPPGHLIGTIKQTWSIWSTDYNVKNESGQTVLKIKDSTGLCGSVRFSDASVVKYSVVGKIAEQKSSLMREHFLTNDIFGVSFPIDLDVRMKAVMLGACFLIDFMYYEQ